MDVSLRDQASAGETLCLSSVLYIFVDAAATRLTEMPSRKFTAVGFPISIKVQAHHMSHYANVWFAV